MITFPPCKINIGLQVLSKREDGFHNIASFFYPLPLTDVLEVITAKELSFHPSGIPIPGKSDDNLCVKAWHLLKKDFPELPAVSIYLHKNIPIGSGLGGGSSDAAHMLQLLNNKYRLQIAPEKLIKYAAKLGSDCAFFMQDIPCYITGRGDELLPLKLDALHQYHFMLVCPDIHVNTAEAYQNITPKIPARSLLDMMREPVSVWRDLIVNDFEKPVFKLHPQLSFIKEELYKRGALYASMSGSGSSLYGIFPENVRKQDIPAIEGEKILFF